MKTIVDNLAVEYLDEGQGPIILLLHGWGNTMRYFDTLCAELSGFRLVRLDAPGFGQSEIPREPWSVERYAQFIDVFCKKVGIEPNIILGHSFGGRITIKGVGTGILRPQKIVLAAAAGVARPRTLRNALYGIVAKFGKLILAPFPGRLYARARAKLYSFTQSDYLTAWAMSPTFIQMVREDLSDDAAKITLPALLIWGKNDIVTPLAEGEKLHSLIQNSKLCVIPNAGHFAYQEHPQEVARHIKEFV